MPSPLLPPPAGPGQNSGPGGPKQPREGRAARRARLIKELQQLPKEQRDKLRRVNRLVLYSMGGTVGAMLTLSMPIPWPAVGMALVVLTMIVAIRGLGAASKAPLAQGSVVYFIMALVMSALFSLYSVGLALTWSQQWDYQQCLNRAQTVAAQDQCTAQFKDATETIFSNLLRPNRTSG